eukprot:gene5776-5371_t
MAALMRAAARPFAAARRPPAVAAAPRRRAAGFRPQFRCVGNMYRD